MDELEKIISLKDINNNVISIKIESKKLTETTEIKKVWKITFSTQKESFSFVLPSIYFLKLVSFFSWTK